MSSAEDNSSINAPTHQEPLPHAQPHVPSHPHQPPLPTAPHPSTLHGQQQVAYAQTAPAQHYGSGHAAQPAMQWQQECMALRHSPDMPPICSMLICEADAWRAVLSLHSVTVASTHQIARSPDNVDGGTLHRDDGNMLNSQSREAAYCSALTSLASQCDALFNEVLKLRTLRKARQAVALEAFSEIVQSHSDEVLAIGKTLASNGSINLGSATADLRGAIQVQRNQVSQLREFLNCIRIASKLPLPSDSKLVVGVQRTGEEPSLRELDELFKHIYETSRDVNETSLTEALSRLFIAGTPGDSIGDGIGVRQPLRQFARRPGDRQCHR